MQRLKKIGFKKLGSWKTVRSGSIGFGEIVTTKKNCLYAFVSGTNVKYIGKTVRGMKSRLKGYASPGSSQKTNIRIRKEIEDHLAAEQTLDIYFWECDGSKTVGCFTVNMAAGLEDDIIRKVKPAWNK